MPNPYMVVYRLHRDADCRDEPLGAVHHPYDAPLADRGVAWDLLDRAVEVLPARRESYVLLIGLVREIPTRIPLGLEDWADADETHTVTQGEGVSRIMLHTVLARLMPLWQTELAVRSTPVDLATITVTYTIRAKEDGPTIGAAMSHLYTDDEPVQTWDALDNAVRNLPEDRITYILQMSLGCDVSPGHTLMVQDTHIVVGGEPVPRGPLRRSLASLMPEWHAAAYMRGLRGTFRARPTEARDVPAPADPAGEAFGLG